MNNFDKELLRASLYFIEIQIEYKDLDKFLAKWDKLEKMVEIYCARERHKKSFFIDEDNILLDKLIKHLRDNGVTLDGKATAMVNPAKHCFYCSECNIGGDLITFISKIEGLTKKQSVQFLMDEFAEDIDAINSLPKLVAAPVIEASSREEAIEKMKKWEEENDPHNSFETCANYLNENINIAKLFWHYADASIDVEAKEVFKCLCPFCEKDKNA